MHTHTAYGYGFLMVVLVSLGSLFGLVLLPVAKSEKLKQYYHYSYALLIALGASALFCDAILHLIPEVCLCVHIQCTVCLCVCFNAGLVCICVSAFQGTCLFIPQAFGLHDHGEADDGHAHEEEEGDELVVVWRSCVIILGMYVFFVFEFILHSWTDHSHSAMPAALSLTPSSPTEVCVSTIPFHPLQGGSRN